MVVLVEVTVLGLTLLEVQYLYPTASVPPKAIIKKVNEPGHQTPVHVVVLFSGRATKLLSTWSEGYSTWATTNPSTAVMLCELQYQYSTALLHIKLRPRCYSIGRRHHKLCVCVCFGTNRTVVLFVGSVLAFHSFYVQDP